ncbi:unnamed protein product, partial [Rangifer tarandus platyrhynchus]
MPGPQVIKRIPKSPKPSSTTDTTLCMELLPTSLLSLHLLESINIKIKRIILTYQISLSVGLLSQEYWSGLPFSSAGDLPGPGIELVSPAWQEDSLSQSYLGSPFIYTSPYIYVYIFIYLCFVRLYVFVYILTYTHVCIYMCVCVC